MKRLALPIFFVLLFFLPSAQVFAQGFSDISRSSRFYPAISHLITVDAIDEGKQFFHLYRAVNRAEAVKMILIASGRDEEDVSGSTTKFRLRDVETTDWYYGYAFRAIKLGIVSGYSDGTFRGAQTVNLVEALKMLFSAYDIEVMPSKGGSGFFGSEPGAWYSDYLYSAKEYSLLTDYEYVRPDSVVSRGFFAELVYRFELLRSGDTEYLASIGNSFTITIPRLDVTNVQLKTTDPFDKDYYIWVLNQGIGHALKYPGENGKVFIYGHSSGYSWYNPAYKKVFRALNQLQDGDEIIVNYRGREFHYWVSGREIIKSDDLSALEDSSEEELVISTCWPPDSIRERYLIYAKP